MLLLLAKLAQMEIDEMNGKIAKKKKPYRPFEINGTTVSFSKYVEGARSSEDEQALQQLIANNVAVTFDMSKTKSMDHMWVRLVTILKVDGAHPGRVTIAGVCPGLRNDVAAIAHEKHWGL